LKLSLVEHEVFLSVHLY